MAGALRDRTKALFATAAGSLDSQALVPVIGLYALALGADLLWVGIIVGAYSLVHAPANVAFGHLVDRFGRKRTLMVGLLADAGSLVLYGLARNPLELLAARLLHGLGGGLVGPASMSIVAGSAAPGRGGRTMALYGISLGISVLVGFGLAGALVLTSHDTRTAVPRLTFLLAATALSGVLAAATLRSEGAAAGARRSPASSLLRSREVLGGLLLMLVLYLSIGAFVTLYPAHMRALLGTGADRAVVLSFIAFALTSVAFHYPGGILADRRGPHLSALVGLGALGTGFLLIPVLGPAPGGLVAMGLLGLGHAFLFPSASAAVSAAAPKDGLGRATGLLYACLAAGAAVGAPLMAAVAGVLGIPTALALTAVFVLPGLVGVRTIWRGAGNIAGGKGTK